MPRCNLRLKNHALRHCAVFVAKSIQARRDYIIKWNYCLNCLARTHSRPACESTNRCAICGAKHHSMLHRERPHDVTFASFTEETAHGTVEDPKPIDSEEPSPVQHEELEDDPHDVLYSLMPLATVPSYWSHIISPLVRINLIHKGNPMWVNLLDDKSESSFLLRRMANMFPEFTPDYRQGTNEYGIFEVTPTYEPRWQR